MIKRSLKVFGIVTVLFVLVIVLGVGRSSYQDFIINIDYKNEHLIFEVCNPTNGYIVFHDSLGLNSPEEKAIYGTETEIKLSDGSIEKGPPYEMHLADPFQVMMPQTCQTKTVPDNPRWEKYVNDKGFKFFRVVLTYKASTNFDDLPLVVQSDWFEVSSDNAQYEK